MRRGQLTFIGDEGITVILQVGTHTGQIDAHWNSGLLQQRSWADAATLEDLRSMQPSGGKDYFGSGLHCRFWPAVIGSTTLLDYYAFGSVSGRKIHSVDPISGEEVEVGSGRDGVEVSRSGIRSCLRSRILETRDPENTISLTGSVLAGRLNPDLEPSFPLDLCDLGELRVARPVSKEGASLCPGHCQGG